MPNAITDIGISLVEYLLLIEREMLIFTLFWFVLGMADEVAVDGLWLAMRWKGERQTHRVGADLASQPWQGKLAVMVAAWREDAVIATTVATMLEQWRGQDMVLYIGCYGNDPATLAAAMAGSGRDHRLRIVAHDRHGPTTKADCLNRLYQALCHDEKRMGRSYTGVILHDSDNIVSVLHLFLTHCGVGRKYDQKQQASLPVCSIFLGQPERGFHRQAA